MRRDGTVAAAFRAAFPLTLPILTGFLFLGTAYGILMKSVGCGGLIPVAASAIVFSGAAQFAIAGALVSAFDPIGALALALLLGARHIFYGVSMLSRYDGTGRKKFFLIYMLCDESFSINVSAEVPPGVDRGWFYLAVTLLDYSYWVTGTAIGALAGELMTFDARGVDFVLTALFVVIFVEQWRKEAASGERHPHAASILGLAMTAICLAVFGRARFIVASMAGILTALALLRGRVYD